MNNKINIFQYSDAELFHIKKKYDWADVLISESRGLLMIYSNYGSFCHVWNSRVEETLKEFVIDCDFDYFMKKAYQGDYLIFDHDETIKEFKNIIKEYRREGGDKNIAREAWNELSVLQELYNERDFDREIERNPYFQEFTTSGFDSQFNYRATIPNPQCTGFWESLWPIIKEELQKSGRTKWLNFKKQLINIIRVDFIKKLIAVYIRKPWKKWLSMLIKMIKFG